MATFLGVAIFLLSGCKKEKEDLATLIFDSETVPMIDSDSVTTLISDSGLIRYKLVTKTWQFFEKSKDPHWYFPDGFYVEQFDSLFHIEVSIKSDTAWRYTNKQIWKLKGNVFIKNIIDETFSSEELFWDEKKEKIYSDKYIKIVRPNKGLVQGLGFESNQSMTSWRIIKPFDTDLYFDENKEF
ncbi:LPS export ABC transporter periplasmic protein LptC [Dysgonomonas sp. 520]|nr:LPS export ABC transporter periplasmic protein LptC [Dysgonomonas sp. 520]